MIGRQIQFITLQPADTGLRVLRMAGAAVLSATPSTRHSPRLHATDATATFPRWLKAATIVPMIEPNTTVQPIHSVI